MKPKNIYQIENNQQNQVTCLLFYYKSKSSAPIEKIFDLFLRLIRYLHRLEDMYILSVLFSDTEKHSCFFENYSCRKLTLSWKRWTDRQHKRHRLGTLHYVHNKDLGIKLWMGSIVLKYEERKTLDGHFSFPLRARTLLLNDSTFNLEVLSIIKKWNNQK